MKNSPGTKIRTLMMIDDSPVDQMLCKRIALRSGVIEDVICFSLAEDALAHLQTAPDQMPDLILLDVNMPRMDGFEFLEAATKAMGEKFCVVVVMLTTSLDSQDVTRASQFEVVKKYLDKPLTEDMVKELPALI